jgi:hypothetical protein
MPIKCDFCQEIYANEKRLIQHQKTCEMLKKMEADGSCEKPKFEKAIDMSIQDPVLKYLAMGEIVLGMFDDLTNAMSDERLSQLVQEFIQSKTFELYFQELDEFKEGNVITKKIIEKRRYKEMLLQIGSGKHNSLSPVYKRLFLLENFYGSAKAGSSL